MHRYIQVTLGAALTLGLVAYGATSVAGADPVAASGADHAVFVETDNPSNNQVIAYARANDGTLTFASAYDTNGRGGQLNGSVVDHVGSQGALTYDAAHSLLFAVNAGSNNVSVFSVNGDQLNLRQVVPSFGTFPVSVAVNGDLVYVLNALSASVSGFRITPSGTTIAPIAHSTRSLGLTVPSDKSQFVNTPAQLAFSPNGTQLAVTTKANGNDIDVYAVSSEGTLSASPVVNARPGTVPFAESFDSSGDLVVANANATLSTFSLNANGTISVIDTTSTEGPGTCWVAQAQGFFYTSNTGGSTLSGFSDSAGALGFLGTAATGANPIDAASSSGGQFLYVQAGGADAVEGYSVSSSGALSSIGSVTVPGGYSGEGIVAA
jgi:6-phosphogluconolactonase (cycloisomerase 2 family)